MALSVAELELQNADYLPAREVMGRWGKRRRGGQRAAVLQFVNQSATNEQTLTNTNSGDVRNGAIVQVNVAAPQIILQNQEVTQTGTATND